MKKKLIQLFDQFFTVLVIFEIPTQFQRLSVRFQVLHHLKIFSNQYRTMVKKIMQTPILAINLRSPTPLKVTTILHLYFIYYT